MSEEVKSETEQVSATDKSESVGTTEEEVAPAATDAEAAAAAEERRKKKEASEELTKRLQKLALERQKVITFGAL
jgi:hypothetical protein